MRKCEWLKLTKLIVSKLHNIISDIVVIKYQYKLLQSLYTCLGLNGCKTKTFYNAAAFFAHLSFCSMVRLFIFLQAMFSQIKS